MQNEAAQDIARARYRSRLLSSSSSSFLFFFFGGGGGSNLDTATVKKGLLVSRKAHFGDVCVCVCVCVFDALFFVFSCAFSFFRFSFFFLGVTLKKKESARVFLFFHHERYAFKKMMKMMMLSSSALSSAPSWKKRVLRRHRARASTTTTTTTTTTRMFFNTNNDEKKNENKQEENDGGDFITNLVVKLFPGALDDPEPAGLKRMTKEEWPDQWPANCEEFLEPIEDIDDTRELRLVRRVLKQTQMETKKLGIAYDANTHGWSGSSFHTQLDGQGCGLLIAETTDGVVFGGYNPKGWLGYGEWVDAISAFLFVYARGKKKNPTKCAKIGGSGMAIIDEAGKSPQWGPDGLKIQLESKMATSRLGTYYGNDSDPNVSTSLFGVIGGGRGSSKNTTVRLKSLRVYVKLEDSELEKNYKPNAFQFQDGELEKLREND